MASSKAMQIKTQHVYYHDVLLASNRYHVFTARAKVLLNQKIFKEQNQFVYFKFLTKQLI